MLSWTSLLLYVFIECSFEAAMLRRALTSTGLTVTHRLSKAMTFSLTRKETAARHDQNLPLAWLASWR